MPTIEEITKDRQEAQRKLAQEIRFFNIATNLFHYARNRKEEAAAHYQRLDLAYAQHYKFTKISTKGSRRPAAPPTPKDMKARAEKMISKLSPSVKAEIKELIEKGAI